MEEQSNRQESNPIPFKAETRQLLDILIHSLYREHDIFLRELISNASDALTRLNFEMLTQREINNPEIPLEIRVSPDPDSGTLTITDTGVGMTADELSENLGTIAHSGARAFISAIQTGSQDINDIIGQFGVGFYSAFMVAEWIQVISQSYLPGTQPASWFCTGADTYTLRPAEAKQRGTAVTIKLKEDSKEFLQENHLRQVLHKHSDFIPFPIYIGSSSEQVNQQTALWRQSPRQLNKSEYDEFYHQLTLDPEPPIAYTHLSVDAPVQMYAILFIPSRSERNLFSSRKEDGLKLYSRKVLIQEYCRDLLPDYFRFVQGVVDSEDLPLNVSRETVQSNRLMIQLKKLITAKIITMLGKLADDEPDNYTKFWDEYSRYIKEGIAIEQSEPEDLYPLLRFHTTHSPDRWSSLTEYLTRKKDDQSDIYYLLGDDEDSIQFSPHLDVVRKLSYEVLLLTDPIDAFMLVRIREFQGHPLKNIANAKFDLPKSQDEGSETPAPELPVESWAPTIDRFKKILRDQVVDVRMTDRLSSSPARLVDPEGMPSVEYQRVFRLLKQEIEKPKKILELNPHHPIILSIANKSEDEEICQLAITQVYEDALLVEGLHPNPASMIERIQKILEAALSNELANKS